jgi:hypothetical protein
LGMHNTEADSRCPESIIQALIISSAIAFLLYPPKLVLYVMMYLRNL